METPTERYREVARRFREQAGAWDRQDVSRSATPEQIAAAEQVLGCRFPDSYRWFQLEFGDLMDGPFDIYGVGKIAPPAGGMVAINLEERRDGRPALPSHLIAFSDNGGGDLCCFDTSAMRQGECPVVWWDHAADELQVPQPAGDSFTDWLEAELEWLAAEERWSYLDVLRGRLRTIGSFARAVLRARQR